MAACMWGKGRRKKEEEHTFCPTSLLAKITWPMSLLRLTPPPTASPSISKWRIFCSAFLKQMGGSLTTRTTGASVPPAVIAHLYLMRTQLSCCLGTREWNPRRAVCKLGGQHKIEREMMEGKHRNKCYLPTNLPARICEKSLAKEKEE